MPNFTIELTENEMVHVLQAIQKHVKQVNKEGNPDKIKYVTDAYNKIYKEWTK